MSSLVTRNKYADILIMRVVKMFTFGVRIMKVRDLICKGSILYNVEGTPN
jgi:hypothetical protein